jgi:hypothetical protein
VAVRQQINVPCQLLRIILSAISQPRDFVCDRVPSAETVPYSKQKKIAFKFEKKMLSNLKEKNYFCFQI